MSEIVTVRLSAQRVDLMKGEDVRELLQRQGIDPTNMACRREGDELVYESARFDPRKMYLGVAHIKTAVTDCDGSGK